MITVATNRNPTITVPTSVLAVLRTQPRALPVQGGEKALVQLDILEDEQHTLRHLEQQLRLTEPREVRNEYGIGRLGGSRHWQNKYRNWDDVGGMESEKDI
jgi:hypothetical protein